MVRRGLGIRNILKRARGTGLRVPVVGRQGKPRHVEGASKGRLPQAQGGAKQESPCAPCAQTALATANEITCQIEGSTMGQ
jgi:hypothetical protein